MGMAALTIGAIVLAAGHGRRMGAVKPLVPIAGKPMLCHVLDALAAADLPAIVVTGAHRQSVHALAVAAAASGTEPVSIIHADDHARGMAHSLRAGLLAVPGCWAGALVVLADMPFVHPASLGALARALAAGAPAVVPVHDGRRGNPAGFSRACFPALLALHGDAGARSLLNDLGAVAVPVVDPGVLRDIDRPADLPAQHPLRR